MSTMYVTSAETFSGKSALCVGMGVRLRKDGLKAGYMKPVNVHCPIYEGLPYDEDVEFAKKIYGMTESTELLMPVALTPAKFEQQLRGPEVNYAPRLMDAFSKLSKGRDLMVLEGGRSLREGYVANLPPLQVVNLTDAQVLGVVRYDDVLMVDRAMTAQNYFKDHLMGIVINGAPPRADGVRARGCAALSHTAWPDINGCAAARPAAGRPIRARACGRPGRRSAVRARQGG